jgi:hypothetical protein
MNKHRTLPSRTRRPSPSAPPGRKGKVKTGILLWALGVPIPLILLFVLLRGCT